MSGTMESVAERDEAGAVTPDAPFEVSMRWRGWSAPGRGEVRVGGLRENSVASVMYVVPSRLKL